MNTYIYKKNGKPFFTTIASDILDADKKLEDQFPGLKVVQEPSITCKIDFGTTST